MMSVLGGKGQAAALASDQFGRWKAVLVIM
jgi:hypothetical protein